MSMTKRLSRPLKKKVPDLLADIAATTEKPLKLWFQDEARIGQKNKITRRGAERGTRPFALKDQRTASAYIFGAICPALGKAASLVMPFCNTEAMALHLQEIALAVEPGAHAVLFVDQAGWHVTAKLQVPENMTLVPFGRHLVHVFDADDRARSPRLRADLYRALTDILGEIADTFEVAGDADGANELA